MHKKKPHSRGHSHRNSGNRLKSNAWMVILGGGLHNFSDGLAIGASFATSLTAGFGTTIAVFFHELPHDIGDFAVLRHAGLTMQNAVIFNIFNKCFLFHRSFIRHVNRCDSNEWIFLFIDETFIYIYSLLT